MTKAAWTIFLFLTTILITFAQDELLNKGNSYLNSQQFDKAEQIFRAAIKTDQANLIYQCQLGLTLIQAKKYADGQEVLREVLKRDSLNVGAIWYSGIGFFYNVEYQRANDRFEKALTLLDEKSPQYYAAHWFIGKAYSNLLRTHGLTYAETDRMFECYEEYLRLQPNAEDAPKIKEYIERKKVRRPPSNVKVWIDL